MSSSSLMATCCRCEGLEVPGFVTLVLERLQNSGHQAYIVGGAVRDSLLNRPHEDWDVATSASASQIRQIFSEIRHYALKHETVTLLIQGQKVEVTTFRGTGQKALYSDLSRRDFTINAMAFDPSTNALIDPFEGCTDLRRKLIRAVGDPAQRFREDPIRLMRAVRLATELGFTIDPRTLSVMQDMAGALGNAARERIRDELIKLLLVPRPSRGFYLMRRVGLLSVVIPELLEGYLKRQNKHHNYTVFKHVMVTLDTVPQDLVLRLAALFHDIAKPRVRTRARGEWHFIGHEKASSDMAREILSRLRFASDLVAKVTHLVEHHMIGYSRQWSDPAVRRWIRRVGTENLDLLFKLRKADLIAHGKGGQGLDLIQELEQRVRDLLRDSVISTRDLAIDGHTVMRVLGIPQGPEVGRILDRLMALVTDHPELNTPDRLVDILKKI